MSYVVYVGGVRRWGCVVFFFFKQKTAYEVCGRDWSSDVCSSDLGWGERGERGGGEGERKEGRGERMDR